MPLIGPCHSTRLADLCFCEGNRICEVEVGLRSTGAATDITRPLQLAQLIETTISESDDLIAEAVMPSKVRPRRVVPTGRLRSGLHPT
jgi:hypothetical protein